MSGLREIGFERGLAVYADSRRAKNTGSGVACAACVAAGRECPAVKGALIEYVDAIESVDAARVPGRESERGPRA